MSRDRWRRRVGSIRPSHLMYTAGVGGLADLPNLTVIVNGIDQWRRDDQQHPIKEPRLLAAVNQALDTTTVDQLHAAPWQPETNSHSPSGNVGVPVTPFPQWYRCTVCNVLNGLDSREFDFENKTASRPDLARFVHNRGKNHSKARLAVPARFILACAKGHLDDFPYVAFVHRDKACANARFPRLHMHDYGGNLGANVAIRCDNCGLNRNIRQAMGDQGRQNLPRCRGRHPHLGDFESCDEQPKLLVLGASNQWFGRNLSVLAVPDTSASRLANRIAHHAGDLAAMDSVGTLQWAVTRTANLADLKEWPVEEIWSAWQQHQATNDPDTTNRRVDIRTPEWEAFTHKPIGPPEPDFALNDSGGVPHRLSELFQDVVQVERLREVRALIGFTRLEAPDPEDPDAVTLAPIKRGHAKWVPASEVRGEGLFLRVSESLLTDWENRVADEPSIQAHREAYGRYRNNRPRPANRGTFDPYAYWPGPRYIALHTLSHLLIRAIALECGYSSASLSERIYAGDENDPRGGILIYTAVPDAEGSLGGLVSLGEPEKLDRIVLRALRDATQCSSDPLCAERTPQKPAEFLHGAACHVCTFVSETTCERGNRFLDRRFVVPFEPEKLALLHGTDLLGHIGSL